MKRDSVEILRILEDCEDRTDALFEGAEWCYREQKDAHESEAFLEQLKVKWEEVHGK